MRIIWFLWWHLVWPPPTVTLSSRSRDATDDAEPPGLEEPSRRYAPPPDKGFGLVAKMEVPASA